MAAATIHERRTRDCVAVLGGETTSNLLLVDEWRALGIAATLMTPATAAATLDRGDVALAWLDVLPWLDGVEPGLDDVVELVRRGVRVLNTPAALLAVHDKLATRDPLVAAGVPHPATAHVVAGVSPSVAVPCVLKQRFGCWGRDVFRCETRQDLTVTLRAVYGRSWFHRHGVLVQELLPSPGWDVRTLVAGGRVVGAARRVAAPGECAPTSRSAARSSRSRGSRTNAPPSRSAQRRVAEQCLDVLEATSP